MLTFTCKAILMFKKTHYFIYLLLLLSVKLSMSLFSLMNNCCFCKCMSLFPVKIIIVICDAEKHTFLYFTVIRIIPSECTNLYTFQVLFHEEDIIMCDFVALSVLEQKFKQFSTTELLIFCISLNAYI